jgi:periplasmic protein TonB
LLEIALYRLFLKLRLSLVASAIAGFISGPTAAYEELFLPAVTVQPQYPEAAIRLGINKGYVIVEFTVTKNGTVQDVTVLRAEPPDIFDQTAVQAAMKFRFKPKIIKGEAVDVFMVQNKIVFELMD